MKTPVFPLLPLLAAAWTLGACQAPPAARQASVPAPASPAPSPRAAAPAQPLPPDSVPAIARREVIRRQEAIRQMDEAALRASQAMAQDDLEGAVSGYRRAFSGLPASSR